MSLSEAAGYEMPFEHIRLNVYPIRSQNRRAAYAEKWWQYAEARPGMRNALKGKNRFISTPGVAKHRIFVWMMANVLCNQGTLVFGLFGIGWGRQQVGSRIWQKRESCDARVPTYEAAEPTQSRSRRV
jgi:hypothetical protein